MADEAGPSQPHNIVTISSDSEREDNQIPEPGSESEEVEVIPEPSLAGSGWGSGAIEKYLMMPFEIKIKSKNQDPTTHRRNHCELSIPRRWALANGFTKDTGHVMFTSKALEEAPPAPDGPWMKQRFRKPPPDGSPWPLTWVIRYGWKEFAEKHGIRMGWKVRFTPDPVKGAQHLRVQSLTPSDTPGTETVVELDYYTSAEEGGPGASGEGDPGASNLPT